MRHWLRFSRGMTGLFILWFLGAEATKVALAEEARILHFPSERAVGQVFSRPQATGGFGYGDDSYGGWESIGLAQGEVTIPTGHQAQLRISMAAADDLSFLSHANAELIDSLYLRGVPVHDEQLRYLSHLPNLRFLELEQSEITDACGEYFRPLQKLQWIDLGAFDVHKDGYGVGDKTMAVLATLPELESIDLRLTQVTDEGIAELAQSKSLKSISIAGTTVGDKGVAALASLDQLRVLGLGVYSEGCQVTDEGMQAVGKMQGLEALDLSGTKVTDAGLAKLQGLTNLKSLQLDETKITNAGLALLEPLQRITYMRLSSDINDEGAMHLSKLKNLTGISANLELTDAGVAYLSELPKLEQLMLSDPGVTDASLDSIAKMDGLKTLWFQHCHITDRGIARLEGMPNLEYLLFRELQITTDCLKYLASLPNLRNLNLVLNRDTDPNPQWQGLEEFTQIERLSIEGDAFESKDMAHVVGLKQLKQLEVDPRKPLLDTGIAYLAELKNLEGLDLRSTLVSDVGVQALADLENLEYMTISCMVTDDGLQALKSCKKLRYLQIASPYVTQEGIARLAKNLPALQSTNRYSYRLEGWPVTSVTKDKFFRKGSLEARTALDALEDQPPPKMFCSQFFNIEAEKIELADLHGKVVVVDFCTMVSGTGVNQIDVLKNLLEKYRESGLELVSIHTTKDGGSAEMYAGDYLISWPMGVDDADKSKEAWHVDRYPAYYLIDRSGKLRIADIFPKQLEAAVKLLLDE